MHVGTLPKLANRMPPRSQNPPALRTGQIPRHQLAFDHDNTNTYAEQRRASGRVRAALPDGRSTHTGRVADYQDHPGGCSAVLNLTRPATPTAAATHVLTDSDRKPLRGHHPKRRSTPVRVATRRCWPGVRITRWRSMCRPARSSIAFCVHCRRPAPLSTTSTNGRLSTCSATALIPVCASPEGTGQVEQVRPARLGGDRRREAVDGQNLRHVAVEDHVNGDLLLERVAAELVVNLSANRRGDPQRHTTRQPGQNREDARPGTLNELRRLPRTGTERHAYLFDHEEGTGTGADLSPPGHGNGFARRSRSGRGW